MLKFKYLTLIFLLLVALSFGQTTVLQGGELSGSNSWQGIIRIQGDIIIPVGSRLTIQPGTQILFDASNDRTKSGSDKTRCELVVRGSLFARGQANNKIMFGLLLSVRSDSEIFFSLLVNPTVKVITIAVRAVLCIDILEFFLNGTFDSGSVA